MDDDDIYISPKEVDEAMEQFAKRWPDAKREEVTEFLKDHAKREHQQEQRATGFAILVRYAISVMKERGIANQKITEWVIDIAEFGGFKPMDMLAKLRELETKGMKQ